ncbi:hypothetical protein E2320_015688 [Naja naja]|nr:hypothetical protein E2320_015688 [Naja naja]
MTARRERRCRDVGPGAGSWGEGPPSDSRSSGGNFFRPRPIGSGGRCCVVAAAIPLQGRRRTEEPFATRCHSGPSSLSSSTVFTKF